MKGEKPEVGAEIQVVDDGRAVTATIVEIKGGPMILEGTKMRCTTMMKISVDGGEPYWLPPGVM